LDYPEYATKGGDMVNANLLRGKMAEKQITQGALASKMGISENSLSRKLLGKREFRLSEVVDICSILEIDNPKHIFFNDDVPNMQQNNSDDLKVG
jgi:DNA-binding Xre family transcriptional regulator